MNLASSGHGTAPRSRFPCRSGRRTLLFALLGFLATGCDSEPSGSGSYTVIVDWTEGAPPLGAALVFLSGDGILEASALDEARIWQNAAAGESGVRVLLIHPGAPSSLRFAIEVPDRGRGAPAATLLNLATQANEPILPAAGHRVRVVRSP